MKKTRQYGLDILRIISMLLITTIHYIAYSGIASADGMTVYNNVILSAFSGLTVIAVNIFILITGYFSCEKKLNIKRIITLWIQVFLVGTILTLLATIFLKQPLGITSILKTIFPLSTMHYWFFTMYVILMLISPFINLFLSHITQKQHNWLCIGGFLIICVLFVSNPFIDSMYYMASSRGLIWLVYLYIAGAYIKKYDCKLSKPISFLSAIFVYAIIFALKLLSIERIGNILLLDANSALPFILSILIFVLFKDITIKSNVSIKVISKLSACSFLVYILQEHDLLRLWYWDLFSIKSYVASPYMIVNLTISLLALWPIALLIQWLFELITPAIDHIYNKVYKNNLLN